MDVGFGISVVVFVVLFYFLLLAFSICSYVLTALGLYTAGTRRGIPHAWLAWLPIGNMWILGSLADQYETFRTGKRAHLRFWLLGLVIGMYACMIAVSVLVFSLFFSAKPLILPQNTRFLRIFNIIQGKRRHKTRHKKALMKTT